MTPALKESIYRLRRLRWEAAEPGLHPDERLRRLNLMAVAVDQMLVDFEAEPGT